MSTNSTTPNVNALVEALVAILPEEQLAALVAQAQEATPKLETTLTTPTVFDLCSGRVFDVEATTVNERGCKRKATTEGFCASHVGQDVAAAREKAERSAGFVGWLRETAPARTERQTANKAQTGKAKTTRKAKPEGDNPNKLLAAAMRAEGLEPNGTAWVNAKGLVNNGQTPEQAARMVKRLTK